MENICLSNFFGATIATCATFLYHIVKFDVSEIFLYLLLLVFGFKMKMGESQRQHFYPHRSNSNFEFWCSTQRDLITFPEMKTTVPSDIARTAAASIVTKIAGG